VTTVDWFVVGFLALMALVGLRRGLIAGALSTAGFVAGAIIGARLAPHVLHNGSSSPYTPLVALAGAAVLGSILEGLASLAGSAIRGGLTFTPLRALDSLGGLAFGGAAGLAVVWVLGAVALQLPGQPDLRRGAQRSLVLRHLNDVVPPRRLLNALARFDPLPAIAGPLAPVGPPDPRISADPDVRRAAASVVRVVGTSCGLGVLGSGWIAGRDLVVTAAHVVAGQDDTMVERPGSGTRTTAHAVVFDSHNDVAVLRAAGLGGRPLRLAEARPGTAVAILGYPENRPLTATPGRIGRTAAVISRDAYGSGRVFRTITSLRGRVRHGSSGGPAVDSAGRVETTVFAARVGTDGGYGVPVSVVRTALDRARGPVSTGDCAR
jgi:uncharacterized membrane protein required for colicin V production